jgi:methyltransferase (TIGR00027 family)
MRGGPSRTALSVARRRAEHQALDHPLVFEDPLAVRIVGGDWKQRKRELPAVARGLRAFMVVRSRYAEDELAAAVARGVAQYAILGAGLDTFAYRNPYRDLRVFEIDHPATQQWKRELLRAAQIPIPPSVTFVPVDFETESLAARLEACGFCPAPAFFSWLGVTPYLSRPAFEETIRYIARVPEASGVAFDYVILPSLMNITQRFFHGLVTRRVAKAGEPFQLWFDPPQLADELRAAGFTHIEDLDATATDARYFADRTDGLRVKGGAVHLLSATR